MKTLFGMPYGMTVTGRLKSSPNAQGVPMTTEEAERIRESFHKHFPGVKYYAPPEEDDLEQARRDRKGGSCTTR